MSTITVTDLVPGDVATSADVNATLGSFVTGTGTLSGDNVRLEGIDRRTMSGPEHVVMTETPGDNTIVTAVATNEQNPSATYAELPGLVTVTMTPLADEQIILHATVTVTSPSAASGDPRLWVEFILQQSRNGGAWGGIAGTYQSFRMRDLVDGAGTSWITGDATAGVAGINAYATWEIPVGTISGTYAYRVGFRTTDDSSTGGQDFDWEGTIFVETLGR